jgi:hypothetical protein
MTHLSFIRANADRPGLAGERLANVRGLIPDAAHLRSAATATWRPFVICLAYRAALKRLEAGVEVDLFDDPVLWAELKSVAWAEAAAAHEHRKKAASSYP